MSKYQRKNNILAESLEDHLVMLDLEKSKYFSLNPVATRIWELLDHPKSAEDLCHSLLTEFDVDEKQCKKEVSDLLVEMINLKLITKTE